jgi:ubiquinone/menaquinone biosynthesis C-methylase UbiE
MASTADGWQLVEDSAHAYERYLVPRFMAPGAEGLLEAAGVGPGESVLDLGCGTGIVARRAAARVGPGGRVAGLDLNEGMLAVARAASAAARPAIEWHQGNAAALPFPDGAFDAVLSQLALQFFSDAGRALAEARRVLAPAGRAAFSTCRPIRYWPPYVALADALARHVGPAAGQGVRSIFPEWSAADLRALFARAGFRETSVRVEVAGARYPSPAEMLRQEAASSPLAAPVAALAPAARAALIRDLEAALADRIDDEGLVFPVEVFSILARP